MTSPAGSSTTRPVPLRLPTADHAEQWVAERSEALLAQVRDGAERLRTAPPPEPLAVLEAWDELTLLLGNVAALGSLLSNVHPDAAVRTRCEQAEVDADRLGIELSQDRRLYEVLSGLDAGGLDAQATRLLERTLRDFRRAGVDRDEETRARVGAIRERLTEIEQEFGRHTRDDVRTIEFPAERFAGMPADWLEAHPADEHGNVVATTDYPDAVPVRMFTHDSEVRAAMNVAFLNRGWPQNDPLLKEMLVLRHELATLLGYRDWPSYDAEVKMIGSGDAVPEFIDRIAAAAAEPMRRDLEVLLERYRRDVPDAERITAADAAYYSELVRRERYDVDSQRVRSYLDFAKVRDGLLDVTGRLFGLRYTPADDAVVWHPDVTAYDVHDADAPADGAPLGRIYLDLHPREGKYKHAAQFTLTDGVAGRQLPEGVLVCNFSRGLMEHDHVVTLFHEFGHLVHHVLGGQGRWARFAGVATEWDFVEAPSQMLEEWAWDPEILAGFATDAQGTPIPADLVARMRAADDYGKGIAARVQMFYAAMSYHFHADRPEDLTTAMCALQARYSPYPYVEGTHMFASFGHLAGYTSAYYTYMWSLVIAKDLFSAFDPEHLLDPAVARRYREEVLAPGGARDAADLVARFLGRPYTFDAYAAWLAR